MVSMTLLIVAESALGLSFGFISLIVMKINCVKSMYTLKVVSSELRQCTQVPSVYFDNHNCFFKAASLMCILHPVFSAGDQQSQTGAPALSH